jgi:hypothetical protein
LEDFVDGKDTRLLVKLTPPVALILLNSFRHYRYETTMVEGNVIKPVETKVQFRTERKVPKVRPFFRGCCADFENEENSYDRFVFQAHGDLQHFTLSHHPLSYISLLIH